MTDSTEFSKKAHGLVAEAFMQFATKYPMRLVPTSSDVLITHKAKFNGVTVTSAPAPADGPAAHDYTPEAVQHVAEQTHAITQPPSATATPPKPTLTTEVYALTPYEITVYDAAPVPQQVFSEVEKLLQSSLPAPNPNEEITVVLHDDVSWFSRVGSDGQKRTVVKFRAAFGALPNIPHALPLLILHRLAMHWSDYNDMIAKGAGHRDQTPDSFMKQCRGTVALMNLANPNLEGFYIPFNYGPTEMAKFMTPIFNLCMAIGQAIDPRVRPRPLI